MGIIPTPYAVRQTPPSLQAKHNYQQTSQMLREQLQAKLKAMPCWSLWKTVLTAGDRHPQTPEESELKDKETQGRKRAVVRAWHLPPGSVLVSLLVGLSGCVDGKQNTKNCGVGEVTHSLHGEGHDNLQGINKSKDMCRQNSAAHKTKTVAQFGRNQ